MSKEKRCKAKMTNEETDIAEDCIEYLKKKDDFEITRKFSMLLHDRYNFSELTRDVMSDLDWFECGLLVSNADKIAAAIAVFKELEKENK